MKIYVASPYSGRSEKERYQNTTRAIDIGLALWKKGHYPYIPHLTHFVDSRAKEKDIVMKWEDYIEWDSVWLEACDAILFLDHSKGTEIELEWAKKMGKTIFFSIESIPTVNNRKESIMIEVRQ